METVRMIKNRRWLLTTVIISLFVACNISDTGLVDGEIQNTVMSQQETLLSDGASENDQYHGEYFPLAIGNSWTYTGESSISMEGSEQYSILINETRTLVGTEVLFDREYVLEKQEITQIGLDEITTYWLRYRQDRAGLYEADVSIINPPGADRYKISSSDDNSDSYRDRWTSLWKQLADNLKSIDNETIERARIIHFNKISMINELLGRSANSAMLTSGPPGGVLPDEIQRLRYPLHPRQEWIIRDTPLFYSFVESHEVLDLSAGRMTGFKIRIYNEFLEENDIVYLWYGRCGYLGMYAHFETDMRDAEGNIIGTMISDENLFLESYTLVNEERAVEKAEYVNRDG